MRFEATPHTRASELALQIYSSVLRVVDAELLTLKAVERVGTSLFIQGRHVDLARFDRVLLLGAGKASAHMASALAEVLGERLSGGLVVAREELDCPVRLLVGGHPLPDERSFAAGEAMLKEAAKATERDLIIFLLSGGASALMECPIDSVSPEAITQMNRVLLSSGADIGIMNRVRSRVSRIKGGGLARAFAPAPVICLVLSDVVGGDLASVGSGPLLRPRDDPPELWRFPELPQSVREAVDHYLPKPTPLVEHFVIGSVSLAIHEAADAAKSYGLTPLAYADPLRGAARVMARRICLEAQSQIEKTSDPFCMIFGGETTVKLSENSGRGGRCQEMAVAAAMRLHRLHGSCFLAGGTDGSDGPTDAAGGFVDELTCERAIETGQDVRRALRDHDSYEFLANVAGLIKTGPTGSNVNDLVLFVHHP